MRQNKHCLTLNRTVKQHVYVAVELAILQSQGGVFCGGADTEQIFSESEQTWHHKNETHSTSGNEFFPLRLRHHTSFNDIRSDGHPLLILYPLIFFVLSCL